MDVEDLLLKKRILKTQHKIEIREMNRRIIEAKKENNINNKNKYNTTIKILDILIIIALVSNIGALLITNVLVVKNQPDNKFYEANPSTAKNFNFQSHPEALKIFTAFLRHAIIISLILFGYWYLRNNELYTNYSIVLLVFMVILLFTMLTFDFTNDLGYLLGKLIYGVK